ncbi:MAG: phosphoglucosamine mutase [Deltaproteobacteria bacterium]|nr:phosphoglucosamine mutase [Deltaproteobacteria bacterium]
MKKFFGTDGIRGLANHHPMTPEIAMRLGQAVGLYFQSENKTHRIVIGKDTRRSSYMIELAIASGVCSVGSNAMLLGPMSTPGVGFVTQAMRADAGIMISASHNPYEDNGIKIFDQQGYKLTDEMEMEIEALMQKDLADCDRPTGEKIGKAFRVEDATGRYIEFAKKTFPQNLTLDGLKIVVDCANGAAYKLAPQIFWELGAEVVKIGVKPNGTNINQDCGALHPEKLTKVVQQEKADVGIALDGDADRVILCDENGQVADGDQVLAICAERLLAAGQLKNDTIVGTIMSNMGVESYLQSKGISLQRTQVGDRYILEQLRKNNLNLGGEPSGHVIFLDHTTTGDGPVVALQVLAAMVSQKKKLSELTKNIPLYPQVSTKVRVKEKLPLEQFPELSGEIDQLNKRLKGKGRTVIRYSGTEPVLRLMIEGEDQKIITKELKALEAQAKKFLGAS